MLIFWTLPLRLKLWQSSKTNILTTQKIKLVQLKSSNCDESQKFKMWQLRHTPFPSLSCYHETLLSCYHWICRIIDVQSDPLFTAHQTGSTSQVQSINRSCPMWVWHLPNLVNLSLAPLGPPGLVIYRVLLTLLLIQQGKFENIYQRSGKHIEARWGSPVASRSSPMEIHPFAIHHFNIALTVEPSILF